MKAVCQLLVLSQLQGRLIELLIYMTILHLLDPLRLPDVGAAADGL